MSLIIFYTFVSSIVFVYGIGLECLYVYLENPKKIYLFFIKNFIGVLISVSLIWGLCRYVLNPLRLHFLLPVLTISFLEALNLIFKLVWPKFSGLKPEEKIFSRGLVFFCLYQASEYKECLAGRCITYNTRPPSSIYAYINLFVHYLFGPKTIL